MEGFAYMLCEQGLNILLDECSCKSNPPHVCFISVYANIEYKKKVKQK